MQVFGRIVGTGDIARMELTDTGRIMDECWRAIPDHFAHARLDEMQIMPNHLHAIVVLQNASGATRGVASTGIADPVGGGPNGPRSGSLGAIIGTFKSETTKRVNRMNGVTGIPLWQPNYHERIIRENQGERERIAHYIARNPMNWR